MLRNLPASNGGYLLQNSRSLLIQTEQLYGVENTIFRDVW
jgi:hypothetical protein